MPETHPTKSYGKKQLPKSIEENAQYFRENTLRMCKKYSPTWWEVVSTWLQQAEDNEFKKLAVVEFNKLQIKALPTDIKVNPGGDIDVGVVVLPRRRVVDDVAASSPVAIPEKPKYSPLTATANNSGAFVMDVKN